MEGVKFSGCPKSEGDPEPTAPPPLTVETADCTPSVTFETADCTPSVAFVTADCVPPEIFETTDCAPSVIAATADCTPSVTAMTAATAEPAPEEGDWAVEEGWSAGVGGVPGQLLGGGFAWAPTAETPA